MYFWENRSLNHLVITTVALEKGGGDDVKRGIRKISPPPTQCLGARAGKVIIV